MHLAFQDALELAGEHLAADGGGTVCEQVPFQVGQFVLDHAGGKVVEGFRHFLQILVVILHGYLLGPDNVTVNARDAQAAFRVGYLLIAFFRDYRVNQGYARLADSLPLPLFLYNMPSQVKVPIAVPTVVELACHPNIVGLKDSSVNIGYFNACRHALRERPDFAVLMGPEEAMGEAVLMGASGGVPGGANMFPRLYVDLYEAALAKDVDRVRELQECVMRVSSLVYGVGHHNSSFVKGVKCALSLMGICSDALAAPREPFNAADRALIRAHLVELGALSTEESKEKCT